MVSLPSLWLPILASAVVVFVASFLAWMVVPHHKGDFGKLKDEEGLLTSLRGLKISPGTYIFPHATSGEEMKSEAFKKRWQTGPHGMLYYWASAPSLPRNLVFMFIFYLVVGVFVGYLGTLALEPGATYRRVFRVTGTAAVMAYALGGIPEYVWFSRNPRAFLTGLIDQIVYALLTACVFGWLWPDAV